MPGLLAVPLPRRPLPGRIQACPNCLRPVDPNWVICPNCGALLQEDDHG